MWLRETFTWNICDTYGFSPKLSRDWLCKSLANTCSNVKQLLPTVVFHGDLLYKVAIDGDFSTDIHLGADNEFQLERDYCTRGQAAVTIQTALIQWPGIKLLWEPFFCIRRQMLWRISFYGWICPANCKHSTGVKEGMTLVIVDESWKWNTIMNLILKLGDWVRVLHLKSLVMMSQYLDLDD